MLRVALTAYLTLATGIGPAVCCCALATDETLPGSSTVTVSNAKADKIPVKDSRRSCPHHGGQHHRHCGQHHRHSHGPHDHGSPVSEGARSPATPPCPKPCNLPCECEDVYCLKALAQKGRGPDSERELPLLTGVAVSVCDFCPMPESGMVDYRRRHRCAEFPSLTAPEILRAFQTFRC